MSWASSSHLVPLEEFSNDSLWTHCKCFYSSASADHSSHVLTGGEVCFAEDVSAGARFNPRSLRRVSSVDAGIDPRTQATITTQAINGISLRGCHSSLRSLTVHNRVEKHEKCDSLFYARCSGLLCVAFSARSFGANVSFPGGDRKRAAEGLPKKRGSLALRCMGSLRV